MMYEQPRQLTVVCCIFFSSNHGLWVEKASISAGPNFINDIWFEINLRDKWKAELVV